MRRVVREKFSSQAAPEVLAALRRIAESQGRQFQAVLMRRYGGASGVRDPGALEAALFRPQTGYYRDIVAEAAATIEGLAINHPFVDGNKRIAFAAADVFLRINGWRLQRPPMQIHAEMMRMSESHTFDIAHLDPWLREFAGVAES